VPPNRLVAWAIGDRIEGMGCFTPKAKAKRLGSPLTAALESGAAVAERARRRNGCKSLYPLAFAALRVVAATGGESSAPLMPARRRL